MRDRWLWLVHMKKEGAKGWGDQKASQTTDGEYQPEVIRVSYLRSHGGLITYKYYLNVLDYRLVHIIVGENIPRWFDTAYAHVSWISNIER